MQNHRVVNKIYIQHQGFDKTHKTFAKSFYYQLIGTIFARVQVSEYTC